MGQSTSSSRTNSMKHRPERAGRKPAMDVAPINPDIHDWQVHSWKQKVKRRINSYRESEDECAKPASISHNIYSSRTEAVLAKRGTGRWRAEQSGDGERQRLGSR
ncbi:hypothetical protein Y032_0121g997 [Ancylostoma ceylanicum]|uniref:Uncharacterized protein n=1 Tax=Ancylostoma ceylanicum TaxID=53326 RepID=A0A016TAK0_9BILA|nr:hypothetical protein Y032_0121g997 [Ancylostoma ceylanicum]